MRGVGLHRHDDLGVEAGFAEVDLAVLPVLHLHRDLGVGVAVLVLDDRVRLAESRPQLIVVGEVLKELSDVLVDLLVVFEYGHCLLLQGSGRARQEWRGERDSIPRSRRVRPAQPLTLRADEGKGRPHPDSGLTRHCPPFGRHGIGCRPAEAENHLPRRAFGALSARRGLVQAPGPARTRASSWASVARLDSRAGPVPRVPNAANAGDFSTESYLGTVQWYRQGLQGTSRAGRLQVVAPVRVGQLPREGMAERQAARNSRRRLPAFRAAGQGVPQEGRQPARGPRRQPPPEVRHPTALGEEHRGVRGRLVELHGHPARGLPAAQFDESRPASVHVRPSLRCSTCAATIKVEATVANVTRRGRRVRIRGSFGGRNAALQRPPASEAAESALQGPHADSQSVGSGAPSVPRSTRARLRLSTSGGTRGSALHGPHRHPEPATSTGSAGSS